MQVLPRQFFHPAVAVGADGGRGAFEELIGIEAEDHGLRRPAEDEGGAVGEGKHDHPDADKIIPEYEGGVTASSHNARQNRHLIGGAEARYTENENKVVG